MAQPPIEGSEDRYLEGSELYKIWLEGREARMEDADVVSDNPYHLLPSDHPKRKAWSDGWHDEDIWALDSTGR